MSDQSQGEGWWIASDDKWYPPESHPDHTTSADPSNEPPVPLPEDETEAVDTTGGSWFSSGKGIAVIIIAGLAIAGAVFGVIALISEDDDSEDAAAIASVADTTSTTASSTTTTTSSTTTTTSSTTTTLAPTTTTLPPGSFENPAPLEGGQFEWSERGTTWDTETMGLVGTKRGQLSGDEPGTCYLLLGILTPTEITDGAISSGSNTPSFGAIAAGKYVEDSVGECDDTNAEAAGYGWILDAEVTVGTPYPFFSELFIPGKPSVAIEVVVAGQPTNNEALYSTPDVIPKIPSTK
jgi:hypothetical protein